MGPWDSKLRWQPGGNFQPTRLKCTFNWKECPYAIGKYVWSEIYTDVAEFFLNNNEDLLLKGSFLLIISIIVYSIIYWNIRRIKQKKNNDSILNKIAFDIQDLELRMDMLSYKLQHGTWPSLQQITSIYEIRELNEDKIRLTVSATDSSKSNKNLWLKQFFTNNYSRITSSCYIFGRSPSKGNDLQSLKDLKTLPKTCKNINSDGQKDDESVKEIQIMSNHFSHETDDNENGLEKANVSNGAKEDPTIKALNKNNKNEEEIEKKNEQLLEIHESQKNIKNACEIEENSDLFYENNDRTRIAVEEEQEEGKRNFEKMGHEDQDYSRKYKNVSNNLNSTAKLNETSQIVEENSVIFSASESVVPQLEENSLNSSKVFFQPETMLNPPSSYNLPTIDSAFNSTKPRRVKVAKKRLEDINKCLENLYCELKSSKFFINSKGLYQSNLSDIISESEQIEETDSIDDHNESAITFNHNQIDFYHEDDNNLKSNNIWGQTIIDVDVKSLENYQKISESDTQDINQLIDTLNSDLSLHKISSGSFQTITENYIDEAQIGRHQFESLQSLEDIFDNLGNSNTFKDNLIDLSDDESERNHDLTIKDENHQDKQYIDVERSHFQTFDNIQLEVPNIDNNLITNNNIGMIGKNYLISGKTFIKENIKKTLEHNLEDESLIDFQSINLSSKHQISYNQCGINIIGNNGNTFKEINSKDNLNPISVLPRENVTELEDKVTFDDKSDAENSDTILNKLLIKNNCENLSEIEFDVRLEIQENSKSEYEKTSSPDTSSKSSSLYLTGEGSYSEISNEKITDLIELKSNDRITIASKDSAFYGTPQSSVISINNTENNNKQLDVNISNNNFNYHQCCFEKDSSQNKFKSSEKLSKLAKNKCERAPVKTSKSSSISVSEEHTGLSNKKINHFPTHPHIKSNNSLKRDVKGSKQKPTEEYKRNDNLHKSKILAQNDVKNTLNDSKTNKLSLKAKSNSNLSNYCGQDLKRKSLEGRSKSYITPRKPDFTSRHVYNSLANKIHQRNHNLIDKTLEENSESSISSLHEKKSTMSRKLDLDSKSRSRESIDKSWKSNIPILKSRIELSKNKNMTNNSIRNFPINKSSQFGDTEDMLSCIESN